MRELPDKEEEVAGPSGVINPRQAESHKQCLDQAVKELQEKAKEEEIKEIMEPFIHEVKSICTEIYTPMEAADAKKVLYALGDPYGLALRPQTEETKNRLELAMPEEEVMEARDLLQMVGNIEPISDKAKDTLVQMMEHTAESYYHTAQAAEQFTQLACECSTPQLMIIMKYAVRPIIQVEGSVGTTEKVTGIKKDLPEEITTRVNLTLLPNPNAESIKWEHKSSPTKLLASVIYYLIHKNFGGGYTQTLVISCFNIKPKNMALCITGQKYLSRKDKQSATKRKTTDVTSQEAKRRHQEDNSDDD